MHRQINVVRTQSIDPPLCKLTRLLCFTRAGRPDAQWSQGYDDCPNLWVPMVLQAVAAAAFFVRVLRWLAAIDKDA